MACQIYYYREPAVQPVKIKQGIDWRFACQIFTNRSRTTYFDLTGYAGTCEIRNTNTGVLVQTVAVTILTAAEGSFLLFIDDADTATLPLNTDLRYDVFFTSASDRFCPLQGTVLIDPQVTTT